MILYYKLIGKIPTPCFDPQEWARWFENSLPERVVAKTTVGPVEVSTVFIGLDHSFGDNKPRLFETMCFGAEDYMIKFGKHKRLFRSELDYQERYETWDEAEKGHQRAIEWVQQHLAKIDTAVKVTLCPYPPKP
jgi:hypothetical protein